TVDVHAGGGRAGSQVTDKYPAVGLDPLIGLAVPGRPIGPLVAEDRSAAGVRDQTEPGPYGPRWVRMTAEIPGSGRARAVTTGILNPRVHAPSDRRPAPLEG